MPHSKDFFSQKNNAIKKKRSDLIIKDIRGNVDTRIRKLRERKFDAIMLACAGLKRLKISHSYQIIDPRKNSTCSGSRCYRFSGEELS